MNSIHTGDLGRAMVIADALRRGYQVALPLSEGCRYDLIVERAGRLERVQCKCTRSDGRVIMARCESTSSWSHQTRGTMKYTSEHIEWLAVYDVTSDRCYYIPAAELGEGSALINLRLVATKNGQVRRTRQAEDYAAW